jgi:hypothetical protein
MPLHATEAGKSLEIVGCRVGTSYRTRDNGCLGALCFHLMKLTLAVQLPYSIGKDGILE